jgi:predicted GIY-YIG superfamily endonuclease
VRFAGYDIYVLEVPGGEKSPDVYVGMTTKTVAERVDQHRSGVRPAARLFRSGRAQVESLRLDLVPIWGR